MLNNKEESITMKKKNRTKEYWKGFPEELRLLCLAEVRGSGHYCTKPALCCLMDHMYKCDSFIYEATAYDVIYWIDTTIEMCLFPIEQHEDDWRENLTSIQMIIDRFDELLRRIAPTDYRQGYIISFGSRYRPSIIEYAQKLEVYYSVLYMFTEEWEKLQRHLTLLLMDTERNVENMLLYEEAEKYASWGDWADYHYPGTDLWEPLNWLYRESIPAGKASRLYAKTYEKYVLFLNKYKSFPAQNDKAWEHLRINAESKLKRICDMVLDEIEDEIELSDNEDKQLILEKETFEGMYQRSCVRCNVEIESE